MLLLVLVLVLLLVVLLVLVLVVLVVLGLLLLVLLTVPPLQFGLQRWGVRLHLFLAGSRGVLRFFFGF